MRARRGRRCIRPGQVAGLMLLSPFCAEMLIAYLGPIRGPADLAFSLAVFTPLYGLPAVLIRELGRRFGLGWPGILILAAAFGLLQAGLIDESLFNHSYQSFGSYWQGLPTRIPLLDIDLSQFAVFVGGHIIWSIGAPIAVVESMVPRTADQPWLGRPATVVFAILYAAVAVFFTNDQVIKPGFRAAPARLIGTAIVIAILTIVAFALPRRPAAHGGPLAPAPWFLGPVAAAAVVAHFFLRDSMPRSLAWEGVIASIAVLGLFGLLLDRWSRRPGWSQRHVLVVAAVPLLVYAAASYAVDPQGAPHSTKIISSSAVLAGLLALLVAGYLRAGVLTDRQLNR